jgi:hypothetical protein
LEPAKGIEPLSSDYKTDVIPLYYAGQANYSSEMERTAGFEPAPRAWKARMLAVKHHVRLVAGPASRTLIARGYEPQSDTDRPPAQSGVWERTRTSNHLALNQARLPVAPPRHVGDRARARPQPS